LQVSKLCCFLRMLFNRHNNSSIAIDETTKNRPKKIKDIHVFLYQLRNCDCPKGYFSN
jgi:hypothetical protein